MKTKPVDLGPLPNNLSMRVEQGGQFSFVKLNLVQIRQRPTRSTRNFLHNALKVPLKRGGKMNVQVSEDSDIE